VLAEQGDLGCATSSASSKLVHGGLRYLEQLEFRLVAEALAEREVLLRTAPHLVHPMRFIMPQAPGLRPGWVIRSGLFLYDWLARRQTLPRSSSVKLVQEPYSHALKPEYVRGYAYSDCWVDDARLVIANARAAADLGARIMPRTACVSALRESGRWHARLRDAKGEIEVTARVVVNAAGPWAERVLSRVTGRPSQRLLKLVQGSHIVVPRLYDGDHAFIVQNDDGRVIFLYGYERAYTLIGTTELELHGGPGRCQPTSEEIDYLCRAANRYFARQVSASDVVWSYCGARALVDDGATNPSRISREYLLHMDGDANRAPLLSVLGGKITTYRRLAERALEKLAANFPGLGKPWTAAAPLPGGDMPDGLQGCTDNLIASYPRLPANLLRALVRRHGSRAATVLGAARSEADLGEHYGEYLYSREIDYFVEQEWAFEAEDVLWRRTKTGLHLSHDQQGKVRDYMTRRPAGV
jgi:glycerol-3-phosphate dehydrogenase